ncbi:hybrid sensor histidine kinase/response regulator [Baaleninema sp.]|uniref:hybrid sensor histidine kinase/response regulator n=1 Tax=Baaleninema sp. TaxID=3101197 RepID=UPI003CFF38FB
MEDILIVDDQPDNLRVLSSLLEQQGYSVRRAIHGQIALNAAEAEPPVLILLDIMMPQMSGYEVCEKLKDNERTREIPIIFLSALGDVTEKVKAFEVGGVDYITKPFQFAEVLARIEHQLTLQSLKRETQRQNEYLQQLNTQLEERVAERTAELQRKTERLIAVEEELRRSLVKEKEINEFKSNIITTISHEYRTPLTTIFSTSELLEHYRHKLSEEKFVKYLKRIQESVKYLTSLFNDVMFVDRMQVGQLELNCEPIDLEQLCYDLIDRLQTTLKSGQTLKFSRHKAETISDKISNYWDKHILLQILNNLLLNAIKFSSENKIIELNLIEKEDSIQFAIRDKGVGIAPENLERLFELFYRGKNSQNIRGTGLGLTIVKKCVDLCNGSIEVESEIDRGTTFTVTLPRSNEATIVDN